MKQTATYFFSGICTVDGLSTSLFLIINGITMGLSLCFDLSFVQYTLLGVSLYAFITVLVSAIDTYMTRKIRIKREAIKSIELMLNMVERKRWP